MSEQVGNQFNQVEDERHNLPESGAVVVLDRRDLGGLRVAHVVSGAIFGAIGGTSGHIGREKPGF